MHPISSPIHTVNRCQCHWYWGCPRTKWMCCCIYQQNTVGLRKKLQCFSERMFGNCVCSKTIHYLLGCHFKLVTDGHSSLQWLSSQQMEGLLARWDLITQEFDFTIMYHSNADALRQCTNHNAAVGHIFQNSDELKTSATPGPSNLSTS